MDEGAQPRYDDPIPPLLGRVLHLDLRPAARLTWVGAGWAAVCGMVASGALYLGSEIVVRGLLVLVLADPVLGAVWAALFEVGDPFGSSMADADDSSDTFTVDGHASLAPRVVQGLRVTDEQAAQTQAAVEKLSSESTPTSFWSSLAAGFQGWFALRPVGTSKKVLKGMLGSAKLWLADLSIPHRQRGLRIALLYGLALLLALALGRGVAVVVAVGLLFPLVVWFAVGGSPLRDGWTRAVLEIGLPWAIGLVAFTSLPAVDLAGLSGLALSLVLWAGEHMTALAVALLFVIAFYGKLTLDQPLYVVERRTFLNLPQFVVVALLVIWRQPLLAGVAAILVLAQMLFQPYLRRHRVRWYLRSTQWMMMGAMLIAAIGVAATGI